jgi:hypothetical protein
MKPGVTVGRSPTPSKPPLDSIRRFRRNKYYAQITQINSDYLSADFADYRRLLFKNNAFRFYGAEEQLEGQNVYISPLFAVFNFF